MIPRSPENADEWPGYFRELLIDENMPLMLLPSPLTIAMIASEIPAAINPYSMAVAPAWSRQNLKAKVFIYPALPLLRAEMLRTASGSSKYTSTSKPLLIPASKVLRIF